MTVAERLPDALHPVGSPGGGLGEVLRAEAAYRRRMVDLLIDGLRYPRQVSAVATTLTMPAETDVDGPYSYDFQPFGVYLGRTASTIRHRRV
jgi:hypothetical protein